MIRLGINIDHIATIREARKTSEPDPVRAAVLAELGGADGITVHLREDSRHIQERDVRLLAKTVTTPLNLEMALWQGVIDVTLDVCPYQITLVPEKREEITTEGGLDIVSKSVEITKWLGEFSKSNIRTALFIDPDEEQVLASCDSGADAIEFHTGAYANAQLKDRECELDKLINCALLAARNGLAVHAGHGLTYTNIHPILEIPMLEEVNIGHTVISRSFFTGIERAVAEMKAIVRRY